MYEQYFGLRERPFDLAPNPRFLFLGTKHREALVHLRYGLTGRPGLTLLLGEAGTGKTTLVKAALQAAGGSNSTIVHLSNPTLTRLEFYEYLACGFGFTQGDAASKTTFLRGLERALVAKARDGGILALVVDEAQSLSHELLEEIRLLTNTEAPDGTTMAVAIVGQPELADRLNEPRLRQLKQRISLRCQLAPFDVRETAAYIAARARIAGGSAEMLFTRDAVLAIHERAKGIPRMISVICDNALVNGFAMDVKPVSRPIVLEVCRDFELERETPEMRSDEREHPFRIASADDARTARPTDRPAQPTDRPGNVAPVREEKGPERAPMFSTMLHSRRSWFF